MCNQSPVTLHTAVIMIATEFAKGQKPFSIHEITKEVRRRANDGKLEIPEVEVQGASFRFDIHHARIKNEFDELWRTGVFDPTFTLTRQFNGTYFEYTPTLNSSAPAQIQTAPASVTTSTPTTAPGTSGQLPMGIQLRISSYLTNCRAENFCPSLKNVQSAIKRSNVSTGYSCEFLRDFIEDYLGYGIVDDSEDTSYSLVVTI